MLARGVVVVTGQLPMSVRMLQSRISGLRSSTALQPQASLMLQILLFLLTAAATFAEKESTAVAAAAAGMLQVWAAAPSAAPTAAQAAALAWAVGNATAATAAAALMMRLRPS